MRAWKWFSMVAMVAGGFAPVVARADLSGDYTVTVQNKEGKESTQKGKIFLDGKPGDEQRAVRMEMSAGDAAQAMVFLTRPEENAVYMLMPEAKTYFRMSISEGKSKAPQAPGGQGLKPSDFKTVGRETVSGHPTVVKEAPLKDENGKATGTVRVYSATDLNDEPIKTEFRSKEGITTTALITNPDTGDQPASRFQVPKGYTETKLPSLGKIFDDMGQEAEKEQQKEAKRSTEERLRKSLPF